MAIRFMIQIASRDILNADTESLVNTVNCLGVENRNWTPANPGNMQQTQGR